jgi:hypothetical protein
MILEEYVILILEEYNSSDFSWILEYILREWASVQTLVYDLTQQAVLICSDLAFQQNQQDPQARVIMLAVKNHCS